jgi:hypothetical protein
MSSNDNGKHKLEEEVESSMVRKRLQLSDDNSGDDDSSDSLEEEEEVVSSEESLMNQLDTTSPSSEPRTPPNVACALT